MISPDDYFRLGRFLQRSRLSGIFFLATMEFATESTASVEVTHLRATMVDREFPPFFNTPSGKRRVSPRGIQLPCDPTVSVTATRFVLYFSLRQTRVFLVDILIVVGVP